MYHQERAPSPLLEMFILKGFKRDCILHARGVYNGRTLMAGGNSHQRAIAEAAKKRLGREPSGDRGIKEELPARFAKRKVGPETDISQESTHPQDQGTQHHFRLDFSLTLVLAVMSQVCSLFPPSTKILAGIWIVVMTATAAYPLLHLSDWILRFCSWGKRRTKLKAIILALILLLTMATLLRIRLWSNFHSSLSFSAEPDILASTTRDSNPIRLSITDTNREPIQNLDLAVRILDKSEDYLGGMRQMSNIPGVWIRGPSVPDATAWIKGPDGQSFALSAQDALDELPVGRHWFATCPRLTPDSPLRLAIGTITKDKKPPKGIRVSGDYEVVESGGIRVVYFDEVVDIKTNQ